MVRRPGIRPTFSMCCLQIKIPYIALMLKSDEALCQRILIVNGFVNRNTRDLSKEVGWCNIVMTGKFV